MCIQVVHDQYDLLNIRVHDIYKILNLLCPVYCGTMLPDTDVMHATERFHKSEYTTGSVPGVFGIHLFVIARTHRPRLSGFSKQLIWLFVHANYWNLRVIGEFIYVQNVLHTCYEFRICFRWETPVLAFVRSKPVFLRDLRIASRLIGSSRTTFSSSSNNRIVHLL